MAFRLPRFPRSVPIVDAAGKPLKILQQWMQSFAQTIESQELRQDDLLTALVAAQAAADAANAAAAAATVAAADAQTAADTAQVAADNAQDAVDAIVVPPSGSRVVTADDSILPADSTILADATGGDINLALPAAGTAIGNILVRKTDGSANLVNILAAGGENVNGGASITLNTTGQTVTLTSDHIIDWYA